MWYDAVVCDYISKWLNVMQDNDTMLHVVVSKTPISSEEAHMRQS